MKRPLFFICLLLSVTAFSQQKRLALVIGNSNYEQGGILKNPVNDANLMASVLLDLGFDVIKRTDATKQVMDGAILDFWRMLASYDVTLFYYAGHGVQVDGINYLLPIDAKAEDELALKIEAVDVGEVVSQFERYPDNVNIVILDACRDNPFRSWSRSGSGGFTAMTAPSGTIIAFATSPGATASDGEGQYGLYTENLTQQMRVGQRIEDVFINTRNKVREISSGRQNPQEWSQLTGSFYFKYDQETIQSLNETDSPVDTSEMAQPGIASQTYEKLRYKEFGFKQGLYLGDQRLRSKKVKAYLRASESPATSIYTKYHRQEFWGLYFSGLGIGMASGFLIYDLVDGTYPEATIAGMTIGLGVAIPGLVLLIKAVSTYDQFIDLYNPDSFSGIGLGVTENGFGLVVTF